MSYAIQARPGAGMARDRTDDSTVRLGALRARGQPSRLGVTPHALLARKRRSKSQATATLYTTPPTTYGHQVPWSLATQNALAAQYGGNTPNARFHAGVDEPRQAR